MSASELVVVALLLTVARIGSSHRRLGVDEARDPSDQQGPDRCRQALSRRLMGAPVRRTTRSAAGDDDHTGRPGLVRPELSVAFLVSAATLLALLGAALFANAWATLAAAIIVVALALLLRPLRNRIRRRSSITAAANAEFAASISELSEISREVRVFGVRREARWRSATADRRHSAVVFQDPGPRRHAPSDLPRRGVTSDPRDTGPAAEQLT